MTDDEIAALQDELTDARTEIERLQSVAADREATALRQQETAEGMRRDMSEMQEKLASAETDLAARGERIGALDSELAALREENSAIHARLQAAVGKYREVLLTAAPEIPEDMVKGESLEELEASLETARNTVLRVRERLESQAQVARVPAGSPPRLSPDFSTLSPVDKIRLGLTKK